MAYLGSGARAHVHTVAKVGQSSSGKSGSSGFTFIAIIGFFGVSAIVMYQRRILAETSDVANELKLVHNAERYLSRALRANKFADAKLHEAAASVRFEEQLMEKASTYARNGDKEAVAKTLMQELRQERGAHRTILLAKSIDNKARSNEHAAEVPLLRMGDGLSDMTLRYDHKEDMDALSVLNASLADFDKMDKALEARQAAIHAAMEKMRLGVLGDDKLGEQLKKMLDHEKDMAQRESEASRAAQGSLQHAEQHLEKENAAASREGIGQAHMGPEDKFIAEALKKAQAMLQNARQNYGNPLDGASVTSLDLAGLEAHAKELMKRRDALHGSKNSVENVIALRARRKQLIDLERRSVSKRMVLQRSALPLRARVSGLIQTEERLMVSMQQAVENGDRVGAAAKLTEILYGKLALQKQNLMTKLKHELAAAEEEAQREGAMSEELKAMSEDLRGSERANVGGQDPGLAKTLKHLNVELKSLEAWEANATARHNALLVQADSLSESQGLG